LTALLTSIASTIFWHNMLGDIVLPPVCRETKNPLYISWRKTDTTSQAVA